MNWNIEACLNLGAVSVRKASTTTVTLPNMRKRTPVEPPENLVSLPIREGSEK